MDGFPAGQYRIFCGWRRQLRKLPGSASV